MITVLEVLGHLKLDKSFAVALEIGWKDSMAAYDGIVPRFLEADFYRKNLALTGADSGLVPLLDEVADIVRKSPDLLLLAWHAHHYLCFGKSFPTFTQWPELDQIFGENCGIFYLMIGLSSIPVFLKRYHEMGIPEKYAKAAAKWLPGTIEIYKSAHDGYPGHTRRQLHWMRNYIDGRLFRIGRFEFMNQELPNFYGISAYKNKTTGQVIALAADRTACAADGLILYADEAPQTAAFTTDLSRDESSVTGNPVSPRGFIINQAVRLKLSEWECVLAPGDFTPGIHIPGGGKMTMDVCGESLREALSFYKKYFPEKQVKAFVCGSWIFNPDLERLLPESNLAGFMRQVYLFPWKSTGKDGLFFIFGRDDGELSEYPRDNSVRRAMLSIFDEGKRLRCGGMFFLPEHLDHFGSEYYRAGWQLPENIILK